MKHILRKTRMGSFIRRKTMEYAALSKTNQDLIKR